MCQIDNMFHTLHQLVPSIHKSIVNSTIVSLLNLNCYCEPIGYSFPSLSNIDDWIPNKVYLTTTKITFLLN